jgi:hypothetical protein
MKKLQVVKCGGIIFCQYLCVLSEKERSEIHKLFSLLLLRVSKLFYRTGGRSQRTILDEAGESN